MQMRLIWDDQGSCQMLHGEVRAGGLCQGCVKDRTGHSSVFLTPPHRPLCQVTASWRIYHVRPNSQLSQLDLPAGWTVRTGCVAVCRLAGLAPLVDWQDWHHRPFLLEATTGGSWTFGTEHQLSRRTAPTPPSSPVSPFTALAG